MTNLRTVARRRSGSINFLPATYAKKIEIKAVMAEKIPSLTDGRVKDFAQSDTRRIKKDEYIHQSEGTAANQPEKSDNAKWDESKLCRRNGRQMRYPKLVVLRKAQKARQIDRQKCRTRSVLAKRGRARLNLVKGKLRSCGSFVDIAVVRTRHLVCHSFANGFRISAYYRFC